MNARKLFALVLLAALTGCGGISGGSRQLVSVSIGPTTADAQNFPAGQVQFTAIGTFSQPPSPVQLTSADVRWCIGDATGHCVGNIATGAFVSGSGVAQCGGVFAGTVTVLAGQPAAGPPPLPDTGFQLGVFGAAQLTCP